MAAAILATTMTAAAGVVVKWPWSSVRVTATVRGWPSMAVLQSKVLPALTVTRAGQLTAVPGTPYAEARWSEIWRSVDWMSRTLETPPPPQPETRASTAASTASRPSDIGRSVTA